jgi:hypothetical protein
LTDDPSHLEGRIERIAQRLQDVERRLQELESSAHPQRSVESSPAAAASTSAADRPAGPATGISPALIGRTLVVLGGAFLLRAITESDVVSRGLGTALGLVYALLWIGLADREAGKRRSSSASFHGLAGAVIAFPLLWESTVRFDLLSEATSAALLALLTMVALAVAWRRHLRGLAWILTTGSAFTALGLAVATKAFTPYVIDLLALALATLWMGYVLDWHALAWFTAALANLVIMLISAALFLSSGEESRLIMPPLSLMLLQLSLLLIYVGSVAGRVLARRRDVGFLESLQAVAVVGIGLGGGIATLRQTGVGRELLAAVSLGMAAGGYAAVFSIIDKRLGSRSNFIFFSTLALVFTVVGSSALFTGTALVLVLVIVALLTAWLGSFKARATLSLHGAVYAVSAAGVAGVLGRAVNAFVGPPDMQVQVATPSMLLVLAVSGVCAALPVAMHGRTWGRFSRLPKLALIVVVVLALGTIAVRVGLRLLPAANDATPDVAFVGVLRTAVLAISALILAMAGRAEKLHEAVLLVYPVLILSGMKLLFEDLRTGRPATLFVSLVIYGGALIVAPRLARGARLARFRERAPDRDS